MVNILQIMTRSTQAKLIPQIFYVNALRKAMAPLFLKVKEFTKKELISEKTLRSLTVNMDHIRHAVLPNVDSYNDEQIKEELIGRILTPILTGEAGRGNYITYDEWLENTLNGIASILVARRDELNNGKNISSLLNPNRDQTHTQCPLLLSQSFQKIVRQKPATVRRVQETEQGLTVETKKSTGEKVVTTLEKDSIITLPTIKKLKSANKESRKSNEHNETPQPRPIISLHL
jgi:hypothetical protein